MPGNSTLGALKVNLGIDSAQFTAGLTRAESGLAGFGRAAGIGLAAVATAALAAGAAMAVAVKGAIDHADALSKSAQKAGVTVEALSRLAFARLIRELDLDVDPPSTGRRPPGLRSNGG